MHEPDFSRDTELHSPVRTFFGIALIMLGLGVGAWLIVSIINLLNAGSVPGLVQAVMPGPGETVTLGVPGGEVTLPEDVFRPIGYFLVCIVYMIVAVLAGTLINGGTSLLQPDVARILRRLVERLERK